MNVTVFPTYLVSYPRVRFMFCNLAHSLSAEKVNHELLCTAVMYAEGCERRASFCMWTSRPQFHPVAEVIGVDPSILQIGSGHLEGGQRRVATVHL